MAHSQYGSQAFYAQVLADLGAPATANNVSILQQWDQWEGTIAKWNPLASEQNRQPGSVESTGIPGAPSVQNYKSLQYGANETALELQAIAPDVVAALQRNAPIADWENKNIIAQINHWGTHGFANFLSGGPKPGSVQASPADNAGTQTGSGTLGGGSGGASPCKSLGDSVAGGIPGISGVGGFFSWIAQSCVYRKILIFGLAGVAVLYGLKLVGVPTPIQSVPVLKKL